MVHKQLCTNSVNATQPGTLSTVCRHAVYIGTPVPLQLQIRKRSKRSQPQRGKLV
jgi:hypothetical protein